MFAVGRNNRNRLKLNICEIEWEWRISHSLFLIVLGVVVWLNGFLDLCNFVYIKNVVSNFDVVSYFIKEESY